MAYLPVILSVIGAVLGCYLGQELGVRLPIGIMPTDAIGRNLVLALPGAWAGCYAFGVLGNLVQSKKLRHYVQLTIDDWTKPKPGR